MRIFLGVELSSELRARLGGLKDELRPRFPAARWVPAENLHLTLRFVGETSLDRVETLRQSLRGPVRSAPIFDLALRGLGFFPNVRGARVLWVGLEPVDPTLLELHRRLESVFRRQGFDEDVRPFRPHLTIARFKHPQKVRPAQLPGDAGHLWGSMSVGELVLFESRLSPSGARYDALERFELGGRSREQLV